MTRRFKSRKGVGHPHPKIISGPLGKTLKRCENDPKANVIIIDVDDDDDDEDIPQVPESQKHNVKGSSVSRNDGFQIPVVICIDEDDPDISVEEGVDNSNSSSSSRCPSSSNQTGNFPDEDGEECQFLHETSPVKLSKCKRTYCAKSPSRNRYGLGPDSDGDFSGEQSDKDELDSEYMEDKLGELRVLWEKANKMRKSCAKSGGSVKDGQFTTSSAKQKVEVENEKKSSKNTDDTEVGNGAPSSSNNIRKEFDIGSSNSAETRVSDDLVESEGKNSPADCHLEDTKIEAVTKDSREAENQCADNVTFSKLFSFENFFARDESEKGAELQEVKEGQLDDEAGGDVETVRDCLINNREKLKETDEYKRAEEKEWASRHEALQLQAEEAQRARLLLKRKKTESLRLLDMERRQKQRVEEIRKTQKKDEEDMNMKDKLRAEVRDELKQLEMKSLDMGSLLRGLGVHVSGGLQPQKHEIRAAYKKALFSFHPDRAPASDIRKLVEAEEKFKLISRMKDKFLLS